MDSELLLKFIGYFPDYLSALSRTLYAVLDNLCRNSCTKKVTTVTTWNESEVSHKSHEWIEN